MIGSPAEVDETVVLRILSAKPAESEVSREEVIEALQRNNGDIFRTKADLFAPKIVGTGGGNEKAVAVVQKVQNLMYENEELRNELARLRKENFALKSQKERREFPVSLTVRPQTQSEFRLADNRSRSVSLIKSASTSIVDDSTEELSEFDPEFVPPRLDLGTMSPDLSGSLDGRDSVATPRGMLIDDEPDPEDNVFEIVETTKDTVTFTWDVSKSETVAQAFSKKAWIGLYIHNRDDFSKGTRYKYTKLHYPEGQSQGQETFKGVKPGFYDIRLFPESSKKCISKCHAFCVGPEVKVTVMPNRETNTLVVNLKSEKLGKNDFIALFYSYVRNNSQYISSVDLTKMDKSGNIFMELPKKRDTYNVRFFREKSHYRISRAAVVVSHVYPYSGISEDFTV